MACLCEEIAAESDAEEDTGEAAVPLSIAHVRHEWVHQPARSRIDRWQQLFLFRRNDGPEREVDRLLDVVVVLRANKGENCLKWTTRCRFRGWITDCSWLR